MFFYQSCISRKDKYHQLTGFSILDAFGQKKKKKIWNKSNTQLPTLFSGSIFLCIINFYVFCFTILLIRKQKKLWALLLRYFLCQVLKKLTIVQKITCVKGIAEKAIHFSYAVFQEKNYKIFEKGKEVSICFCLFCCLRVWVG